MTKHSKACAGIAITVTAFELAGQTEFKSVHQKKKGLTTEGYSSAFNHFAYRIHLFSCFLETMVILCEFEKNVSGKRLVNVVVKSVQKFIFKLSAELKFRYGSPVFKRAFKRIEMLDKFSEFYEYYRRFSVSALKGSTKLTTFS